MSDPYKDPPHYRGSNGVKAIDVIEGFNLNFRLGSAVDYILRHASKGEPLKDLKKAAWHLAREIAVQEADAQSAAETERAASMDRLRLVAIRMAVMRGAARVMRRPAKRYAKGLAWQDVTLRKTKRRRK